MALEIKSQVKKPDITTPKNVSGSDWWTKLLNSQYKVSDKDRMFFTEQLALLLETGASLQAGLQALKSQSDNPAMVRLIDALMTDIAEGKSLSYALSRHPEVFSTTYVNLVSASEAGGFMHEVLEQLLDMDEKREQLHNTLVSAFTYPVFLIVFSIAVVLFVLVVVFPKFGEMFSLIRDQLPVTTVFLMAISELLTQYWLALLGGVATGLILVSYWMKSPGGIQRLDQLKLSTPLFKDIFIQLYLVQSLRVMSLSLQHGVSIMDTLTACRDVVRNGVFRQFITRVEARVQEGAGIAVGFSNTHFIPAIVEQMISTGEETGNLPKVMGRVADHYERELSRRLTALSKLAEPVMLLVMGLVVGILVSSLILPIFKLSRAVN
ncbi:MAG: type II secretion system F family protein [Gammaproteobacteria bacterium]